jgi:hypothetical protein
VLAPDAGARKDHIVNHFAIALALATACAVTPAFADSITASSTTGGSTVAGTTVTSSNAGSVTATGNFGHTAIRGGSNNFIGVTSTGAAVTVQILKDGVDPNVPTGDSIAVSSINTSNTGTVTATGRFQGAIASSNAQSSSSSNSIGVSAAGTSVNITISHK